jgi:hypothetical protein
MLIIVAKNNNDTLPHHTCEPDSNEHKYENKVTTNYQSNCETNTLLQCDYMYASAPQ